MVCPKSTLGSTTTGDAIAGGLYGLLLGDAVGVPYEFKSAANLPPLELIEIEPPAGFRRSHPRAPKGAWSDDGAQALCLHSARLAAQEATFERAIQRAVSLGNDTDTTAAVVGGIAGVRHGLKSIPSRWLLALNGGDMVEPLAKQLLSRWD